MDNRIWKDRHELAEAFGVHVTVCDILLANYGLANAPGRKLPYEGIPERGFCRMVKNIDGTDKPLWNIYKIYKLMLDRNHKVSAKNRWIIEIMRMAEKDKSLLETAFDSVPDNIRAEVREIVMEMINDGVSITS